MMRLNFYGVGMSRIWTLTVADDADFLAAGEEMFENLSLSLLSLEMVGTEIAWHKTYGGLEYDWIGYWQGLQRFRTGLALSRATWIGGWLGNCIEEGSVLPMALRDVLRRMSFSCTAVRVLRPFLGPIHAWLAAAPMGR